MLGNRVVVAMVIVLATVALGGTSQARPTASGSCGVATTFEAPLDTIITSGVQHHVLFGGGTECTVMIASLTVTLTCTDLITGKTAIDSCGGYTKAGVVAVCSKDSIIEPDPGLWVTTSETDWADDNGPHSLAGLPFAMVA